jgi:hypothetical protein
VQSRRVEGTRLKEKARLGLAQQAWTSLLSGRKSSCTPPGVLKGARFGAILTPNRKVPNTKKPRGPFLKEKRASDRSSRLGPACCRGDTRVARRRASSKAPVSERLSPRIAKSQIPKVEGTLRKGNARLGFVQKAVASALAGRSSNDKSSGVEEGAVFGAIPTSNIKSRGDTLLEENSRLILAQQAVPSALKFGCSRGKNRAITTSEVALEPPPTPKTGPRDEVGATRPWPAFGEPCESMFARQVGNFARFELGGEVQRYALVVQCGLENLRLRSREEPDHRQRLA